MSFQQGLSGLNVASKGLDVIGNNVANGSTIGFKMGQAEFSDVFAASLTGGGASPVGLGSKIAGVVQQFTQGNITATNNPLDIAINGGGFYRLSNAGSISYGRNGQFQMDKNGFVVTSNGLRLTGYAANAAGQINTGSLADLQISNADLAPLATGISVSGATGMVAQLNLDSRATTPTTVPFDYTDPQTYNNSTALTIYDSLGTPATYSSYFLKTASNTWDVYSTVTNAAGTTTALNQFTGKSTVTAVTAPVPGAALVAALGAYAPATGIVLTGGTAAVGTAGATYTSPATSTTITGGAIGAPAAGVYTITGATIAVTGGVHGTTTFSGVDVTVDSATGLVTIGTDFVPAVVGPPAVAAIPATTGSAAIGTLNFDTAGALAGFSPLTQNISAAALGTGAAALSFPLDFLGTTQYGGSFSVNDMSQDGFSIGRLAGFNASSDGTVIGRYTNGQTKNLGQIVLAAFRNPQGLQPQGDNVWVDTAASGVALVGVPGSSGAYGALQSAALEESNVDLTAELVNMITAQRAYQANAQSIKTQDAVLQTLVNLR